MRNRGAAGQVTIKIVEGGLESSSNAFDLSYTLPLNPNNGTINLSAGVTANRVIEKHFEKVDIRAAAQYFDLTLRQPILRNPRQEFALGVTATRRESGTSI